jgi:hypothetical protein
MSLTIDQISAQAQAMAAAGNPNAAEWQAQQMVAYFQQPMEGTPASAGWGTIGDAAIATTPSTITLPAVNGSSLTTVVPSSGTASAANTSPALAPSGLPLLTDIISGKVTPPGYQPQVGSGPAITNAAGSWVSAHIGNYGLVILGGLLVVGALLISQKDNISKAAVTVAKVAAV